ncbi:MAG: phosphoglycerate dehydrogenase [Alphaproteobacteria bacterium]|nr:phosphoglycerate dehydrogenase [Alphaproteobacteria bacterium]
MIKVAVASRSFSKHPVLRAELLARYPSTTFNDEGKSLAGDELAAFLQGHEKIVTALERLDDALFDRLPGLKVVAKYGVGLDMIDLEAMQRRGLQLGWTGGVNRRSVSELVISYAVALLRHVPQGHAQVLGGGWKQLMGRQLSDRTVGIVGLGHIGKDLTQLLKPWGCRVIAHDIKPMPDFCAQWGVDMMELEALLRQADVITLHLPLDDSTRNILSAERMRLMRSDAILINAARGGLLDEAELKAMLMEGRLAGAALDVFAVEPPTDMELIKLPNFLVTPHIGGSAEEAVLAMGRAAIEGLDRFGDPLKVAQS